MAATSEHVIGVLSNKQQELDDQLIEAALNGDLIQVKILLTPSDGSQLIPNIHGKSSKDKKPYWNGSPLLMAAQSGNIELLNYLVERGASLSEKDKNGGNVLDHAAFGGYLEMFTYLFEQCRERNNTVFYAALGGRIPMVEHMRALSFNFNARDTDEDSPLLWVAASGQPDMAEWLLRHGATISERNSDGDTAMIIAARQGNIAMVEYLIRAGVSVTEVNEKNETPLHEASYGGHLAIVQLLLRMRALANAKNKDNCTPLHLAAMRGHVEVAAALVTAGAKVKEKSIHGITPLFWAIIGGGYIPMIEWLLGHGATVDETDEIKQTALHWAVSYGHIPVAERLLAYRANLKAKDIEGRTLLHYAASEGHVHMLEWLLAHGANLKEKANDKNTALHEACRDGHLSAAQWLFARGLSPFAGNRNGMTALHLATSRGHIPIVEYFFTQGVDISKPSKHKMTAMHWAVVGEQIPMAQWLITHTGDSSILSKNESGYTPLDFAAQKNNILMIRLFVQYTNGSVIAVENIVKGRRLGGGVFGAVYQGTWYSTSIAIKELFARSLPDDIQRMFEHEARIMTGLYHPNIVLLYGLTENPNGLVMEYLSGGSLYDRLRNGLHLDWMRRVRMALEMASGLLYLHQRQVLHRDLKSPNVLLDADEHAKLGDFGLSSMKEHTASLSTSHHSVKGTIRWLAPEMLFGEGKVKHNEACDIYSLGMIFWELTTGQVPYAHIATTVQLFGWIVQGKRGDIPEDTAPVLKAVTERAWAQDPAARPQLTEIIHHLETAQNEAVTPSLSVANTCPPRGANLFSQQLSNNQSSMYGSTLPGGTQPASSSSLDFRAK